MKRRPRTPTFALLAEKGRLAVVNPENGRRFVISLRDWERWLWAVRVIPHEPPARPPDAYETAHRLISQDALEIWLGHLQLDPKPQRGLNVALRDFIAKPEKAHWRWRRREVAAQRLPASVLDAVRAAASGS